MQLEQLERSKFSVALVCHSYPPVLGGSEIEAQRVCAALLRRGHRAQVLCAGGSPMPDVTHWRDPEGVPVRLFGRHASPGLRDYVYALGVAWWLFRNRHDYDLVYFLMSGLQIAAAMPVAWYLGKPIIMKFSGSNTIRQMAFSRIGRLEMNFIRRWTQRIMILNDGMTEEAREMALDPGKLMWMPNPVDTNEFRPVTPAAVAQFRRERGIPPDAALILYVGRLAPEKELPTLIEAFSKVKQKHPESLLVLIGDGPSRRALENQTRILPGGDGVRFTGMLPVSDVCQWMQAADMFTLVSSLEGLPCSLIEAMSVGLPSVVSDIPANLQLVDSGVHGLVARVRDASSIADSLNLLLGDPELRVRLGRNARSKVMGIYSTDAVLDRYEALFSSLGTHQHTEILQTVP